MTVADTIREMTDIELAEFLSLIISERDKVMSERLREQGVENTLIEMPIFSVANQLSFLKRPAEDVFDFDARGEAEE